MEKRISFRLDAELAQKLRAEARERKTTMTAIIKEAIRKEWNRFQNEPIAPRGGVKPKH